MSNFEYPIELFEKILPSKTTFYDLEWKELERQSFENSNYLEFYRVSDFEDHYYVIRYYRESGTETLKRFSAKRIYKKMLPYIPTKKDYQIGVADGVYRFLKERCPEEFSFEEQMDKALEIMRKCNS